MLQHPQTTLIIRHFLNVYCLKGKPKLFGIPDWQLDGFYIVLHSDEGLRMPKIFSLISTSRSKGQVISFF